MQEEGAMRLPTALGIVVVLCASTALIRLASVQQASNAEGWPQPQGGRSRRLAAAAAAVPCVDHPVDQGATCLEQSMWGKCKEPFLEHACDLSCGRCVSAERRRLLQRVLLVSARQAEPCNSTAGDFWAMRAQQHELVPRAVVLAVEQRTAPRDAHAVHLRVGGLVLLGAHRPKVARGAVARLGLPR